MELSLGILSNRYAGSRLEGMVPRKIVIQLGDKTPILTEALAPNEFEMQELVKDYPDLLPIDEFGLTGPLLVVGREASVSSGAVDLLAMARSGDILVVEFKTGPQNSDFRHVIAQLLDYGAHLWGQTVRDFETTVAVRYFNSNYCTDRATAGKTTLEQAAKSLWPDMSEEEWGSFQSRMEQQLTRGGFHYVVVAQRFTPNMERVVAYMNDALTGALFYAVELVHFMGSDVTAYESRTSIRPSVKQTSTAVQTNEIAFFEQVADRDYAESLREYLEACRTGGYRFEWGAVGVSIRLVTPFRKDPITISWVFPPGRAGWSSLKNVALGFDPWSAEQLKDVNPAYAAETMAWYEARIRELPGGVPVRAGLKAVEFLPEAFMRARPAIEELLLELLQRVNDVPPVAEITGASG
ncbi:MAG: hypothetical protein AB7T32_12425 [Dehalococcoidia bacterium]